MIKVTVGEQKTQSEKPFPKLMIATQMHIPDKGIIVLFSSESNGVVVYTPNDYREVGYMSNSFLMKCFTDYNEPITLQNA